MIGGTLDYNFLTADPTTLPYDDSEDVDLYSLDLETGQSVSISETAPDLGTDELSTLFPVLRIFDSSTGFNGVSIIDLLEALASFWCDRFNQVIALVLEDAKDFSIFWAFSLVRVDWKVNLKYSVEYKLLVKTYLNLGR
ncbi:MAG: hypothetical protein AAFQ80_11705 [Cyanobacteria bacterium J06621_8]